MIRALILTLTASVCLQGAASGSVTFHRDVEPILQARCQGCHRPGEAAPMPLVTYQDARPWAKAIREAVLVRKMPPWFADGRYGHFSNDRRLSAAEIATIQAWVDSGALPGDAKDAPKPLIFADGWTIGKPDAVVEMPVPYQVPASGTVEYTYFLAPTNFSRDMWVENVEVRPGTRAVVHHVVVMVRPPGARIYSFVQPGVPNVPEKKERKRRPDTGEGNLELGSGEVAGTYVPGGGAYFLPPGQARLIPAGSDLIFQMHYTTNGKAVSDRSKIGFVFAKQPPRERVVNGLFTNRNLTIPPGAADHAVHARFTMENDSKLLSFFPHMHVRGKGFEYRATYPTGESETLMALTKYDFNWQLTYYLDKPKLLPKGTVVDVVARFDNSANNPFNPDPAQEVRWGDQTWEEMLAGFVDLALPVGTDPESLVAKPKPAAVPRAE